MAHPFAKHHSQNAVEHRRANKIVRGNEYARGGAVHSDEAADRKLFHKMMAEHERGEMKMEERQARARGGRITAGAESGAGRLQKAHGAGVRK